MQDNINTIAQVRFKLAEEEPTREIILAVTKLEEAMLWLGVVQQLRENGENAK